ncbi:MAG: PEP-CTERM sorting domain-containing protein [Myxococcota bacterium]
MAAPLLACLGLLAAGPAAAVSFSLDVEFDDGTEGHFGTVDISENGGDLDFEITLTDALGGDPDLHEFYFNLVGSFTNVSILDTNAPTTGYSLSTSPSVAGGAGSSFDYGVNFGNGAGPPGNGQLTFASFTLGADEILSISDLDESSFAQGGGIEVNVAAHVQGTDFVQGTDSETVGGVIPEPSTVWLLGLGLALMGARRRR